MDKAKKAHKSGTCKLCGDTISSGRLQKHILNHLPSETTGTQEPKRRKSAAKGEGDADPPPQSAPTQRRLIFVSAVRRPNCYLFVDADSSITFANLRDELYWWWDCCLHTQTQSCDEDMPLSELGVGESVRYEYDAGSTTELDFKVVAEHGAACEETVRVVGESLPALQCADCQEVATLFCVRCDMKQGELGSGLWCEGCHEASACEHDVNDIRLTNPDIHRVAQSPRFFECGWNHSLLSDDEL